MYVDSNISILTALDIDERDILRSVDRDQTLK